MRDDKRLIEDYLPIVAISTEASREKSVRKGHISTLHLWWARRPLVACRAAVYGALVPASRFVPEGASEDEKAKGRNSAAAFVARLCKYPGDPKVIAEAQKHILEAHAARLTQETGKPVTIADIEAGRAPRPKVLDMFAGGGSIPLEALRLGCEAYALDLNPVAHIIQLCTLVYPQKYGKPDPTARGMTGPKNHQGETTWGGLAKEVRYWGEWVLKKVRAEIGDLYPLIPDPAYHVDRKDQKNALAAEDEPPPGYLVPVAYLWTRTVVCKNPTCKATVPLVKQTWLCKKPDKYVALRMVAKKSSKSVTFDVIEAKSEKGLGFDPSEFSKGGNATCPFCGTVADIEYVKSEGWQGRMGNQLMALVGTRHGEVGKKYIAGKHLDIHYPPATRIQAELLGLEREDGLTSPDEPIANLADEDPQNTLGITVRPYGIRRFRDLYTSRQQLALLKCVHFTRIAQKEMNLQDLPIELATATTAALSLVTSRFSNFSSTLCTWFHDGGRGVKHVFARQVLTMVWDYAETNPFYLKAASWPVCLDIVVEELETLSDQRMSRAHVNRGSAINLPAEEGTFDAVITDPPYYDNVPYSSISDYFYVWLKRSIGHTFAEHFSGITTPKKNEIIADVRGHHGDRAKANSKYEALMEASFREAFRVLKPQAPLVVVYAHKTTLGWATLVEGLRRSGFSVTEAWPLDTENVSRMRAKESAALASSIFLVGRKREGNATGSYETDVQPELAAIVRERVETLWDQGVSGADLVIACVGAGLRAFTRFARVEYANGDEVPAERFLAEVETVVLESILGRLSKEVGGNGGKTSLAGVDPATRFYTLWRYTYRGAELDAGEAIIFANGTHVELDGSSGLSSGAHALVEKMKGKYRLRDYKERGDDDRLGLPIEGGQATSLIDALHRTLWLMEQRPLKLAEYLREAEPNRDQMRLVAQALAGPALKGGEMADISPTGEMAALAKLTSNWRSVIENKAVPHAEKADRKRGQGKLFE
jgi:putative DNA methylase